MAKQSRQRILLGNNPNLQCIEVDDVSKIEFLEASASSSDWTKDDHVTYSTDCSSFDGDGDGVDDTIDLCPNTGQGLTVNEKGCAENQIDTDNDGIVDLTDQCPNTPLGYSVNSTGCALFELDTDNDGINDALDQYSNTHTGATIDINGGVVLPTGSFKLKSNTASCPGTATGYIEFTNASDYYFDITVTGTNYSQTFNRVLGNQGHRITNLNAGVYDLSFAFSDNYGRPIEGYKVTVGEAPELRASKVNVERQNKKARYQVSGTKEYNIYVNDRLQQTVEFTDTDTHEIEIELSLGANQIRILGKETCQGDFEETIVVEDKVLVYPNPMEDVIYVEGAEGTVRIFNAAGALLLERSATPKMSINLSTYPSGIYYLKTTNQPQTIEFKRILKQ